MENEQNHNTEFNAEETPAVNPEYVERDATLDEDTPEIYEDDAATQNRILEDSDLNGFQKFIARIDDKKWELYQWIVGIIMGLLAALALFWPALTNTEESSSSFLSVPTLLALFIALIVPNILEKQGLRKLTKLRMALAIAMGVCVVAYFLIMGFSKGFNFSA